MSEPELQPARVADLDEIARIHERAFPESALSAFGHEALVRYYRWLLEGPHDAQLIAAWHSERVVGFCAAGAFRDAMNGFLRHNRGFLALRILRDPTLLLRSALIRERLVQALQITVRFSKLSRRVRRAAPPARRFGVLAIATDPSVRGLGAGRALMIEAETRARHGGYERMVLTVHPDNARAVRFYEQLGWQRASSSDGSWAGAMFKALA